MAVRIRMKKFGAKNRGQWRIVVVDSRSPRDGRFIEEIGHYNPLPLDEKFQIKKDRLAYWLKNGALITDSVKTLLKRSERKQKVKA